MIRPGPFARTAVAALLALFLAASLAVAAPPPTTGGVPTDVQIRAAAAAYFRETWEQNPDLLYEGLQLSEGRVYKMHLPPPEDSAIPEMNPFTGEMITAEEARKRWKPEENWRAKLVYRVRYSRALAKRGPRTLAEQHASPPPRDSEWAFADLRWDVSIHNEQRIEALEFGYSRSAVADVITAEMEVVGLLKENGGILEKGFFPGKKGDWILRLNAATGYPLCDGAKAYFGTRIDPNRPTYMRADYDEIVAGFRRAVDEYETKHGPAFVSVPERGSDIDAGFFLFGHNPPKSTGLRFGFTRPAERAGVEAAAANGDLWDGSFSPRKGTEASMIGAIHRRWLERGRMPLNAGDVLLVALEETNGDARMAMLLAHNTLRAAGRGEGDVHLCGVTPNTTFLRTHLKVLRGGPNPDENPNNRPDYWDDNEGVWYHLFGVGFYEMHNLGNGPVFSNWANLDSAEIHRRLEARLNAMGDQGVDWLNAASQIGEQVYRQWISGQKPDPEKYCFNVWGTHAAHDIFRRLVERRQVRAGKTGPGDPAPGSLPPDYEDFIFSSTPQRTLQGAREQPQRMSGVFSPVSVTWEGGGQKMTFDQERMTLTGSFPVRVAPFVETDGTVGIVWLDLSAAPYTLTLTGAADGRARFVQWEPGGAARRGWALPIQRGGSYTLRVDSARPVAPLLASDGREVPSAGATPRTPVGASTQSGTASPAAGPAVTLFDNRNASFVFDGPENPTIFQLARRTRIAVVQTYHWNGGQGARAGSIGLRDASGRTFGPWRAEGSPGQGGVTDAFWTVRPNIVLPPGIYTIVDSDPDSWSQNIGSDNTGFAVVMGREE